MREARDLKDIHEHGLEAEKNFLRKLLSKITGRDFGSGVTTGSVAVVVVVVVFGAGVIVVVVVVGVVVVVVEVVVVTREPYSHNTLFV